MEWFIKNTEDFFLFCQAKDTNASLAAHKGWEPWQIEEKGEANRVIGWKRRSPTVGRSSISRRWVVFHGNAWHARHHTICLAPYLPSTSGAPEEEDDVFIFEYPGFGARHEEKLSPDTWRKAIFEALKSLVREDEKKARNINLIGISMGTGVIAWAAMYFSHYIQGLYLLTPYLSIHHTISQYLYLPSTDVGRYTKWKFLDVEKSLTRLRSISTEISIIIVYAEKDWMLPPHWSMAKLQPLVNHIYTLRGCAHTSLFKKEFLSWWQRLWKQRHTASKIKRRK